MKREIKKIINGIDTQDGAGVKLRRVLSHKDVYDTDPFLMLDFFNSKNPDDYLPGFPWHPHRGIETVTYFMEGQVLHKDSLGNQGLVGDGGYQWMTAGSGIIHEEMPQASENMWGVQLWINLSKEEKMVDPFYSDISKEEIVVVEDETSKVRIVAGSYKDKEGPIKGREKTDPNFLDISLKDRESFRYETERERRVFLFIVKGEGDFNGQLLGQGDGILYGPGDFIDFRAERDLRLFILTGYPLEEPIAWGGPIVMNSQEEIQEAFRELDDGSFIKHKSKKDPR